MTASKPATPEWYAQLRRLCEELDRLDPAALVPINAALEDVVKQCRKRAQAQ